PAELEGDLRQLRRLPRARLPGDDDDLVLGDRGGDLGAPSADRQLLGIADRGDHDRLAGLRRGRATRLRRPRAPRPAACHAARLRLVRTATARLSLVRTATARLSLVRTATARLR